MMVRTRSTVLKPIPRGPAGVRGPIPDHVWDGPYLAFQNPDGGFETPVNLLGPEGPVGTAQNFDTIGIAAASAVSAGVNVIHVLGYYEAGDRGAARYRLVSSGETFSTIDGKKWKLCEWIVTPWMFGAKGLNVAPYDTAFIQAAFDFGNPVVRLDGDLYSAALTWSSTLKRLYGPGTITGAGTITDFTSLLGATGRTGITIDDVAFVLSRATYPTVNTIGANTCTDLAIRKVRIDAGGRFGVALISCTSPEISDCVILNCDQSTIYCEGTDSPTISGNRLVGDLLMVGHVIAIIEGSELDFANNNVYGGPVGGFALSFERVAGVKVQGNRFRNSNNEAIAGGGTGGILIDGNKLHWDGPTSQDYGMSYVNTDAGNITRDLKISNNMIIGSGKTGIAVGGYVEDAEISNNTIQDVVGAIDATHKVGIEIGSGIGGTVTLRTSVTNNTIRLRAGQGDMDYAVKEFTGANYSLIENNRSTGMTAGFNPALVGANSVAANNRQW